jgi:L-alanine-DL-glutamate epimerase-like enolase superfamily enzyme
MKPLWAVVTDRWSLEVEVRALPLVERFAIATAVWDEAESVFVVLRYGDASGIGEVSPDARWGDSPESVAEQIRALDLSRLAGPFDLEGLQQFDPTPARTAIDIALHDLAATKAGISVAELIGVAGRPLPPTSVTVPISDVPKMVERARGFADHPVIKMKVGFDGDVDAVASIRDVFKNRIRIDANEGWDRSQAIERLKALESFDIELCEQPIPKGDHAALSEVTASTSIPIYADEDVETSADVANLVGVVDGVNLKLRKTGGLREAIKAAAVARAHGLGLMIGCDLESGVAATAQATFAALCDHADVDGPLLLADDPYPGVVYDMGRLALPDGPGLGVKNKP